MNGNRPPRPWKKETRIRHLLLGKIITENGCWINHRKPREDGYVSRNGSYQHRISYELLVGEIPHGKHIDHLCRNRACFNPEHLEPVEPAENLRRGLSSQSSRIRATYRTHCPNGHEYTDSNKGVWTGGTKRCKTCQRYRQIKYRASLRAAS